MKRQQTEANKKVTKMHIKENNSPDFNYLILKSILLYFKILVSWSFFFLFLASLVTPKFALFFSYIQFLHEISQLGFWFS